MNRKTPIIQIKGVGEKTQKLFEKIGVTTVGQLLEYYPRDYELLKEPVPISEAAAGEVCAVRAMVVKSPSQKIIRSLSILSVVIQDNSGSMNLTFFNMSFLMNVLRRGGFYIFRGLVQTRGSVKIMEQPKIYSEGEYQKLIQFIQPKYSLTKGLTNQTIQKAIKQVFACYEQEEEYYSKNIIEKYGLLSKEEALHKIHFPADYKELLEARKRLVFEEFFEFLFLLRKNKEITQKLPNEYFIKDTSQVEQFLRKLPFSLTAAQSRVWKEIQGDLSGNYCMNRLVQGDVGSGKTMIAVLALLFTASNGYQGAMMAPTEVLAVQHYETIKSYIEKYQLPLQMVLLVGSMTAKQKKEAYMQIEEGKANLIIGTHAVIQEKVLFHSLALVVTDEQHRFGVRQREQLAGKGRNPHVLVMSATPIPRTLAIILYGDLHISIIDELPANRLPIKNCVVNTAYRPKAYQFITKQVMLGRQVYVICPMVEEGELEDTENVTEYTQKLRCELPSSIKIASLHGKMRPADKNRIMEEFAAHKIDVLVATTVIEVGINVPNATVIMIENAERFGLAQLHQLRGRVGRGQHQSYCIFISSKEKKETMQRLEILNKSNDGFFIASEDLRLRGPGDMFGIRQSGEFAFRIGDIYNDAVILKQASEAVEQLLEELEKSEKLEESKDQAALQHMLEVSCNCVDFRTI